MKKEDEYVEFKKSLSQLKEGIISLSSMLNKHNKAVLYFGINDDGKVFKFDIGKKTISDISNELRTNLKPLPANVEINEVEVDGINVIKVNVEGEDTPYSAYGRYYIRIDDADVPMTNSQLQSFFEKKKESYLKWEQKIIKCSIDDIDEDLLIDVIRTANEKGRLDYIYRNAREALTKLDLVDDYGNIKTAGYYLFSNKKPLTIKEAIYPTDNRTEFGEIKEFKGNIFECIKEAIAYIQNHMSYKSNIIGIQREEIPEIPVRAIREIVVNSFAHAKYDVEGDYNQFIIYKSSIRIYNPGSIYKDIDPINFASAKVGSKIRNILIASVLYKCGYIDAFGTGFDRTFTLCAQNSVDYEYKNDEFGFTFIFKRNINFLNDKINDKINIVDESIINEIFKNKYITIPELAIKINKSEPTIHRHIDVLVSKGYIKRVGSRKTGYWEIVK